MVEISETNGEWLIKLNNLKKLQFPEILYIPVYKFPESYRPNIPGIEYKMSFDAKWEPGKNGNSIGLGMGVMDGRGWRKAGSAIGVENLETAINKWAHFDGIYRPLTSTPALAVLARLQAGEDAVSGKLYVKNLKIIPMQSSIFPAYDSIVSLTSKAKDGKTLTCFVINKYTDRKVQLKLNISGFQCTKAEAWEVNGPVATSDSRVTIIRKADITVNNKHLSTNVSPHSITAVVFKKEKQEIIMKKKWHFLHLWNSL